MTLLEAIESTEKTLLGNQQSEADKRAVQELAMIGKELLRQRDEAKDMLDKSAELTERVLNDLKAMIARDQARKDGVIPVVESLNA